MKIETVVSFDSTPSETRKRSNEAEYTSISSLNDHLRYGISKMQGPRAIGLRATLVYFSYTLVIKVGVIAINRS